MHKVAVYGSLRRGFGLHDAIRGSKFLGAGETEAIWKMVDLGAYPAVIPEVDKPQKVVVEVYEVDDETLASLDRIEGHPSYYYRSEFRVDIGDKNLKAWIYYLSDGNDYMGSEVVVDSGDWLKYNTAGGSDVTS